MFLGEDLALKFSHSVSWGSELNLRGKAHMKINDCIGNKSPFQPWLVWLGGLSAGLQTKGSPVGPPVRAHAWGAGQVPSRGCVRGNHRVTFFSLSFSLPFPLYKEVHKIFKREKDPFQLWRASPKPDDLCKAPLEARPRP